MPTAVMKHAVTAAAVAVAAEPGAANMAVCACLAGRVSAPLTALAVRQSSRWSRRIWILAVGRAGG